MERNNVLCFYGPHHGVGVSMIASCVAIRLHKLTKKNILYISLDGTEGGEYLGIDSNTEGLDSIKTKLINNVLKPNELLDICISIKPGFYFLKGVSNYLERRQYHPEHIEKIIDILSRQFDLIIIDAGNELDLGLTVGAITCTNNRYLIVTQQHKIIKKYKNIENFLEKLEVKEKGFIINKYFDDNQVMTDDQLKELYNNIITILPNMDYVQGLIAEGGQNTLLGLDSYFDKGIKKIIEHISEELKLTIEEEKNVDKTGIKSIFSGLLKGGLT